jgi:hypothetical protein
MDTLDKYGVRASVLLNSDVCRRYPQIIDAGRQRYWPRSSIRHRGNLGFGDELTPDAFNLYQHPNDRPILLSTCAMLEFLCETQRSLKPN